MTFKFLHLADVHFGASLPASKYPARVRAEHALMRDNAFSNAMHLAGANDLDAVIIAGDLFNTPEPKAEDVLRVTEACERAQPAEVIIIPGNHDHDGPNSAWRRHAWPSNCRVKWEAPVQLHRLKSGKAHIIAQPWTRKELKVNPLLSPEIPDIEGEGYRVIVTHASELHEQPATWRRYAALYAHQLERFKPDYVALGHLHWWSTKDIADNCPVVYPGSFAATGHDDVGPKYYAEITLENGFAAIGRIPSGALEFADFTIAVSQDDTPESIRQILIDAAKPDSTRTVAWVKLVGTLAPQTQDELKEIHRQAAPIFCHLTIHDMAAPASPSTDQGPDADTTAQFLDAVDELIAGEANPRRASLLQLVKQHGLAATANRAQPGRGTLYQ